MTLEIIQETITELERLQAESTQGEWRYSDKHGRITAIQPAWKVMVTNDDGIDKADAALIVALYRSIPALLLILRDAEYFILSGYNLPNLGDEHGERLAKAILGRTE